MKKRFSHTIDGIRIVSGNDVLELTQDEFMQDEPLYPGKPVGISQIILIVQDDDSVKVYAITDDDKQVAYTEQAAINAIVAHLNDTTALKQAAQARQEALLPEVVISVVENEFILQADGVDELTLSIYRRVGVGAMTVQLAICVDANPCSYVDVEIDETPELIPITAETTGLYKFQVVGYDTIIEIEAI